MTQFSSTNDMLLYVYYLYTRYSVLLYLSGLKENWLTVKSTKMLLMCSSNCKEWVKVAKKR